MISNINIVCWLGSQTLKLDYLDRISALSIKD